MDTNKYIRRLCKNILAGKFNWRKYSCGKNYYGKYICTQPLFSSYSQIGFSVNFPYSPSPMPNVEYDWEMRKLSLDEEDWRAWLGIEK